MNFGIDHHRLLSVHQKTDGCWAVSYRDPGKQKLKYFGRGPDAKLVAASWGVAWKRSQRDVRAPDLFDNHPSPTFGEVVMEYLAAAVAVVRIYFKKKTGKPGKKDSRRGQVSRFSPGFPEPGQARFSRSAWGPIFERG
ncbi:MAG: hypothetical protein V1816_23840 [Pseudomonadota bacterium]